MSNASRVPNIKVVPYCKDPMSSCGLFAWGENKGQAKAGTVFSPMFFSGKQTSESQKTKVCWEHTGHGSHQVPCKEKESFSGFDWGGLFGGKSADETPTAPTPSGNPEAPTPFFPTPTGEAPSSGVKVSTDQIMSGIESATSLIGMLGSKRTLSEVEGVCGKQPKGILKSRAAKQSWANCASSYMQSKIDAANKEKKGGLGTGAIVGIVFGSLVIATGIYFATRKKNVVVVSPPVKVAA